MQKLTIKVITPLIFSTLIHFVPVISVKALYIDTQSLKSLINSNKYLFLCNRFLDKITPFIYIGVVFLKKKMLIFKAINNMCDIGLARDVNFGFNVNNFN